MPLVQYRLQNLQRIIPASANLVGEFNLFALGLLKSLPPKSAALQNCPIPQTKCYQTKTKSCNVNTANPQKINVGTLIKKVTSRNTRSCGKCQKCS